MAVQTGSRLFAEMMHGYGVTHLFFVPAILLSGLAETEEMPVERIMVHGEKAAAYMADGYARATGRPGLCMAQHIGASNLAAGLRDAFMACAPMIAITGGPTPMGRYRGTYQEVEDFSQFDAVTKFNRRVDDVRAFPDALRQAFRAATTSTPGPVHLQLQGNHGQVALAEADLDGHVEHRFARVPPHRPSPERADIDAVLKAIKGAERPIVVAGGGVVASDARAELVAFCRRFGLPVATSMNAKDCAPEDELLSLGVVGTYSRTCANQAVSEADLIVFIGSQAGGQVTHNWTIPKPGVAVAQIDVNPAAIGRNYPGTLPIVADARMALQAFLSAPDMDVSDRSVWHARIAEWKAAWARGADRWRRSDLTPMRPEQVCADLSDLMPDDAILVSDTGHSGIWTGTMVELSEPGQRYIRCAGSMGWGFPGAMGVKCGLPERPVICFTGDGAMYYHIAELETAARYGINLIVVVNNNAAINQEIPLYKTAYKGTFGARASELWAFRDVDFAAIARSFGCAGFRVKTRAEFRDAFRKALTLRQPVVIDTLTDIGAFADAPWSPQAKGK